MQEEDDHGDQYFNFSAELEAPAASSPVPVVVLPSPKDTAAAATTAAGRPFHAFAGLAVGLWRKIWRFDEPYYRAVPGIKQQY